MTDPRPEAQTPRPSAPPTPARDTHYDRRMIVDLRFWRSQWTGGPVILDVHEFDALLDAAAERDRLKADAVRDPTRRVDIPAGHALVGGQVVPLETSAAYECIYPAPSRECGGIANYHAPRCRAVNAGRGAFPA